jgi:hypothetical protein
MRALWLLAFSFFLGVCGVVVSLPTFATVPRTCFDPTNTLVHFLSLSLFVFFSFALNPSKQNHSSLSHSLFVSLFRTQPNPKRNRNEKRKTDEKKKNPFKLTPFFLSSLRQHNWNGRL